MSVIWCHAKSFAMMKISNATISKRLKNVASGHPLDAALAEQQRNISSAVSTPSLVELQHKTASGLFFLSFSIIDGEMCMDDDRYSSFFCFALCKAITIPSSSVNINLDDRSGN